MQDAYWQNAILAQFLAALRMLENAIVAAPPEVWAKPGQAIEWRDSEPVGFWYLAFHTLFFLDYYLADSREAFAPPPPFDLSELDPAGVLPTRVYGKDELLAYLAYCEARLVPFVGHVSDAEAKKLDDWFGRTMSRGELLLYQLRHVQHHAAQLNVLLRHGTSAAAPMWVSSAEPRLGR
jgi:hypothetical protein